MKEFDKEAINHVLDLYMLAFLDDYEEEMGRLPNELEKVLWTRGFIDACRAIEESIRMQQ